MVALLGQSGWSIPMATGILLGATDVTLPLWLDGVCKVAVREYAVHLILGHAVCNLHPGRPKTRPEFSLQTCKGSTLGVQLPTGPCRLPVLYLQSPKTGPKNKTWPKITRKWCPPPLTRHVFQIAFCDNVASECNV